MPILFFGFTPPFCAHRWNPTNSRVAAGIAGLCQGDLVKQTTISAGLIGRKWNWLVSEKSLKEVHGQSKEKKLRLSTLFDTFEATRSLCLQEFSSHFKLCSSYNNPNPARTKRIVSSRLNEKLMTHNGGCKVPAGKWMFFYIRFPLRVQL